MRWFRRRSATEGPEGLPPPVFFVHVMKSGGTTITRHLRETYELDQIYPSSALDLRYTDAGLDLDHHLSLPYLQNLSAERRARIRVYIGHFPYVARDLLDPQLLAATVLREPVERTISLLRQLTRTQPWEDEPGERRPLATMPLEEIYEHPLVFGPLIHDHQTKIFSMTAADDPQNYTDPIDVDARRLELAKANLADVDVLGTMERFDDFLDEVEARFGWQIVRGARKNVTPDAELTPIDPSLRRRIAEDNAIDLELYEHARALVASRSGHRISR